VVDGEVVGTVGPLSTPQLLDLAVFIDRVILNGPTSSEICKLCTSVQ
jgi:hypothetical protein